jgi:hypothetical protein
VWQRKKDHHCCLIREFFSPTKEPTYHSLLRAVKSLSRSGAQVMAASFLAWRASQLAVAKEFLQPCSDITNGGGEIGWASAVPLIRGAFFEITIEYVTATALLFVLEEAPKSAMSEDAFSRVIDAAFSCLTRPERRLGFEHAQKSYESNVRHVQDIYSFTLGSTGTSRRMKAVVGRYTAELGPAIALGSLGPLSALLASMRFLRLGGPSKRGAQCTVGLLERYFEHLARFNAKEGGKQLAIALVDTLAKLLWKTMYSSGVAVAVHNKSLRDLVGQMWEWAKRVNKPKLCSPLMTVILCCGGRELFQRNWWTEFAEPMLRSRNHRRLGMDAVPILIDVYLSCFPEAAEIVVERLQAVVSLAFPPGKRLVQNAQEPLDRYVDLICCVAKSKVDYAIQSIVFELLRVPEPGGADVFIPERAVVALRALYVVMRAILERQLEASLAVSGASLPAKKPQWSNDYSFSIISQNREFVATQIEPYMGTLSAMLARIISLLQSPQAQRNTTPDSAVWDELEQLAISTLPFAFPRGCCVPDLVAFLSKSVTGTDRFIRESASSCLV